MINGLYYLIWTIGNFNLDESPPKFPVWNEDKNAFIPYVEYTNSPCGEGCYEGSIEDIFRTDDSPDEYDDNLNLIKN